MWFNSLFWSMPSQIHHCLLHPLNCSSSRVTFEFYFIICVIALLFCFHFFKFYCCALGNMATCHVVGHSDLTIMVNSLGTTIISKHYLWTMFVFSKVLYIYPRTSCMILITWFQVYCTIFLPPLLKGAIGLLAMATIILLAIVWLTTLKTTFSHLEPKVMLSRLWKTSTKFSTFSFHVQMLLHLLFSLNYLIFP